MARKTVTERAAKSYKHADKDAAMRPEVGTQARFTKKLPPKTYHLNNAQISFDLRVETRIPTSSFFRSDVFSAV